MISSAYGRVIYGYGPQANEYLRVADGKESVCVSNSSHEVVVGGPYCPRCGDIVDERDRMVPSPMVVDYATRQGMAPEAALSVLEQYQYCIKRCSSKSWIFGILIASGSEGTCEAFRPVDMLVTPEKRLLRDLFGDDLHGARYHLLVELH